MFEKSAKKPFLVLKPPTMPSRYLGQPVQIIQSLVRHRIHFQIVPTILDGIQFRSIRRKIPETPGSLFEKEGLHNPRSMSEKTIPYYDHRTANMTAKMLKKRDDRDGFDIGIRMKPKNQPNSIPAGRNNQDRNHGDFPVRICSLSEDRSLATWRPCSADQRHHQ